MAYLENIIDSEKNQGDKSTSERLVDKVKSDLTAGRNVQEYDSLSIADRYGFLYCTLHFLKLISERERELLILRSYLNS